MKQIDYLSTTENFKFQKKKKMKITEILEKSRKQTESLLTTNKGTKKESIYKESIFEGLNDKQKKSARKKIRNYVHSIFESLITSQKENKKANVTKLSNEFFAFYKETYRVNDFSFSSIASENTKEKELINNALIILKKELKIK